MGRGTRVPRRPNRSRVIRRSYNIQKVILRTSLGQRVNNLGSRRITTSRQNLSTHEVVTYRVITIPVSQNKAAATTKFHVDVVLSYINYFKSLDELNSLFVSATFVKIFINENARYFPPKPAKLERTDTPGPQFRDPSTSGTYHLHLAVHKETGLVIAISNVGHVVREITLLDNGLIHKMAINIHPHIQEEWDRKRHSVSLVNFHFKQDHE